MTMRDLHTPECFANHMGLYAIEPEYLRRTVAAVKAGAPPVVQAAEPPPGVEDRPTVAMTANGIAVIPVSGPMTKGFSKFSQANTLDIRRAVRAASRSEDVRAILLHIDSPGGMVAGTQELASDIRAADGIKPTLAHIDDCGCSAAYWIASAARTITANEGAEIGSIGVFGVIEDTSKAAEMAGVEVHVISSGEFKGAGVPGVPVTDDHLAEIRKRVMAHHERFLGDVAAGRGDRGLAGEPLEDVADGRVFSAKESASLSLIDRIDSLDGALDAISAMLEADDARERAGVRRARMRRG